MLFFVTFIRFDSQNDKFFVTAEHDKKFKIKYFKKLYF